MKFRRTFKWLLMIFAVQLIGAGALWAQKTDVKADPAELAWDDNLSLIDEDIDALTDKQKLERAVKKIEQMRTVVASIGEMLETVRDEERDIVKINCINEKQAAIKGFMKVAEQSYVNLDNAVKSGDGEAAKHHYTLISVAHQRVQNLAEEARLCTGDEQRFAGRGDIEITEPNNGDEDVDVPDDDILIEDLPDLTPYR